MIIQSAGRPRRDRIRLRATHNEGALRKEGAFAFSIPVIFLSQALVVRRSPHPQSLSIAS